MIQGAFRKPGIVPLSWDIMVGKWKGVSPATPYISNTPMTPINTTFIHEFFESSPGADDADAVVRSMAPTEVWDTVRSTRDLQRLRNHIDSARRGEDSVYEKTQVYL